MRLRLFLLALLLCSTVRAGGVNAIEGGCLDCEPDSCADYVGTLTATEPAQVSPILAVVRERYDEEIGWVAYAFDNRGDLIAWLNCKKLESGDFIGAWRRGLTVEVTYDTKPLERITTRGEIQEWRAP